MDDFNPHFAVRYQNFKEAAEDRARELINAEYGDNESSVENVCFYDDGGVIISYSRHRNWNTSIFTAEQFYGVDVLRKWKIATIEKGSVN